MTSSQPRVNLRTASATPLRRIVFPAIASSRARLIKRSMDLLFAGAAAIIATPALLLISLAIKLESGGPALFAHERIGRGGRRFYLWKFRTMVMNGEEVLARHFFENPDAAAEWEANRKLRKDPRVTRVGRLLRRTSLDELPQLWNILRGEMSLAGPRPIVEEEIPQYGSAFPFYTLSYPGLTGLWQVSGRSETSYRRRIELDVNYVRDWSPFLDLRIFFQTFRAVVRGTGAY